MNETYSIKKWQVIEAKMRQKGKSGLIQVLDFAKEVDFNEVCHKQGAYYGIEVVADSEPLITIYISEKNWENA